MGTVSAKKLNEALEKAKGIGVVEETFTIGDCEIVLRNLRPDEYEAVLDECKEAEELAYLNKFQEGHVCRSIVELNGVSFRDVDFVEVEEADPKNKNQTRTVKRELHDWVRKNVVATWSKEALYTAYRKFSDVVAKAEAKAKEGVTFLVAEENAEERYRRLIGELKEVESEVPPALVSDILQENGYAFYTQPQDQVAMQTMEQRLASADTTEAAPAPAPAPVEEPPAPAPAAAQNPILRRTPLNQQPVAVPEPPKAAPPQEPVIQAATPSYPPHVLPKRSQEIMEAEGAVDPTYRAPPPVAVVPPGMQMAPGMEETLGGNVPEPAVLTRQHQEHTDPRALSTIVERPPTVGLNPKFRPPQR